MCALLNSAQRVAHHENAGNGAFSGERSERICPPGTEREVPESMNNSSSVSSKKSLVLGRTRGAAMVEYALLLVAVLLVAGSAYKALGHKVSKSVKQTQSVLL